MTSRLPVPGGDTGQWGLILNDFLSQSLNSDGTLKGTSISSAGAEMTANKGAVSGYAPLDTSSKVPTINLGGSGGTSSTFLRGDQTWVAPPGAADATTSSKGIVELTNDLGGTAVAPTVLSTHLSAALPVAQGGTGSATQNFVDLTTAQTIAGVKTFSSSPIAPTPTTSTQVAIKSYVDSAVTGSNIVINVKSQGAVGNGTADDTAAVNAAVTAAQASGKNATVYFPAGTYKLTSAITMYQGMTWSGPIGAGEREFGNRAIITNTATDIFQLTADTKDISISNLEFQGSSSNYFLTPVNQATGFILQYSTISNCGFKLFNSVFSARWLGVWFNQNYLNNCASTVINIAGSDCTIRDNFIDSTLAGTPTAAFLVNFNAMSDTLFEGNYITCCPAMGMQISSGSNVVIAFNKFNGLAAGRGSGSDGAGLYISATSAIDVIGNYFGYNVINPFAQYTGAVSIYDASGITLTDNTFDHLPATHNAFTIGQTSGTTDSIRIKGTIYGSGTTSKLVTSGTVTNLTWDEWQGKYKTGASARITDSDYPGTPPNGTTGVVYDTSVSQALIAQRANGSWSHYAVTGTSTGLITAGINATVTLPGTTTTETQISSLYTIAAGAALAGDTYRIMIGGTIDVGTVASNSLTIFVRMGGVLGTQLGGLLWNLVTTAATGKSFWGVFEVVIRGNASASTSLVCAQHGYASTSAVTTAGAVNYLSGTRDMTASRDIFVSGKFAQVDASVNLHVEVLTLDKLR